MTARMRAAVVTGGGGGIGTEVALELAARGAAVVAVDPGVGVQGEPLNEPTATETAQLIADKGGTARASTASVTDREAVRALFAEVSGEFGSLDIVVNTAGILRSRPFLHATEDDWRAVLDVHLNGYLNVLAETLPLMAAAGYGRIVGVTSGAGLARAAADSAAYSCAKRAIAAVTWQLAGLLPDGIALNALSPLAATRMVSPHAARRTARTAQAQETAQAQGQAPSPEQDRDQAQAQPKPQLGLGALDLSSMPAPAEMAPAAAFLAGEEAGACRGQVIFSAGPELSVIAPPRLIEAVRTGGTADFAASLDTLFPVVLAPAEAQQRPTGGANARFGPVFDQPQTQGPQPGPPGSPAHHCLVIATSAGLAKAVAVAVARCGLTAVDLTGRPLNPDLLPAVPGGFAAAAEALGRVAETAGGLDAVVIAPGQFTGESPARPPAEEPSAQQLPTKAPPAGAPPTGAPPTDAPPTAAPWADLLEGFRATADDVLAHAGWLQAAARLAVDGAQPLRIVHLADATSPPQRPAAQAVAQLARCASLLRPELIEVFSVAIETAEPADHRPVAELAARLLWAGDAGALRGAELAARPGWIGIRTHPGPAATASYGTPEIPDWIGDWLHEAAIPAASG